MATSGKITGIDAYVELSISGSSWNLSGDGNKSTLSEAQETPEKTTYQPAGKTRQRATGGLKDWNFSFSGFYNDTAAAASALNAAGVNVVMDAVEDAQDELVLVWGPAGSTSGYKKYSASCLLNGDRSVDSPVDGLNTFSFGLTARSGSLTKSTF